MLFVASIFLRLPAFGIDPMKEFGWTQFERFNNAEVWIHDRHVLNIYDTHPIQVHKFAGYVGYDEQYLKNKEDPQLTVYTSFPPTHFVALFATLKTFGGHYTYKAMEVFGLAIHALSVGLIAYLVYLLTRSRLLAVLGGAIYIFSTGTLWYHMNVYWAHELLVPVFVGSLIVFVKRRGLMRWWESLLFGAGMTLISWTGAVAAVGYALYGLYKFYKTKDRAYLNHLFVIAGLAAALVLVVAQVLITTGSNPVEYVEKVLHRAQTRTAGATSMPFVVMVWRFVNDLLLDYGGYMVIALVLAVKYKIERFHKAVLFVAAFPLVESFIILEHDTVYGFGRLKWLIPVILLICIAGAKLSERRKWLLASAVAAASVLHIALYFSVYQAVK
ncbi:hypothetical protein [Lentzea sp. NBRC 105346]|uniref:hypothetical protein n=1 Tax=Lentzea sp. NBRC 105346 TaxID=3032205 RepID=UPI00255684F8|nr:hypothetical protein [Lentzea sp. NBRC 105346]